MVGERVFPTEEPYPALPARSILPYDSPCGNTCTGGGLASDVLPEVGAAVRCLQVFLAYMQLGQPQARATRHFQSPDAPQLHQDVTLCMC